MVDGIGPTNAGRITTRGVTNVAPVSRTGTIMQAAATGVAPNPAADLAAWGPVVDHARIAELRQAIASGAYKADPQAIADKMIALDVPKAPARPAGTGK